ELELESELELEPEIEIELEPEVELELEPEIASEQQAEFAQDIDESKVNEIEVIPVVEDLAVLKPGSDPEILEIYLEEAEEESENIKQLQQDWKLHPEDENALKNIRRAFHTIKGSGRLVGAMKIGEFSWDFESLLNVVIDGAVEPTEQVIDAVGQAAEVLPELVEELKNSTPVTGDIAYVRGLARALAEFKPDQVLSIKKRAENLTTGIAAPEPPVSTDKISKDTVKQQEETPPDPFVLNEMVNMPGGEVGQPLPGHQQKKEAEPGEQTALQIDPELLVIYQQEVESHLNTVNSALKQPTEDGGLKPTEELYRAIHTINGASRTADIVSIGQLATLLEKPLKIILEQSAAFDEHVLELYRRGHDAIQQMAQSLVENRQVPELPEALKLDLEDLLEKMDNHTVELPDQDNQTSSQFLDTLTMMNESVESVEPEYDDELVEIFIEEATELLDMSDHTLQSWSKQSDSIDDGANFGLVMELQRYLHTLKGGARMADFTEISDLSHELESLFIAVIDARVEKSDDLIDILHNSFDLLSVQVGQAKDHQTIDSSANQIAILQQLRTGEVADNSHREEQLKQHGSTVQSIEQVGSKPDESNAYPEKEDRRQSDRDVVKVRSELLDNLVNSAGEVSIYRARMEQQVSSFGTNLGELGQTITRLKNQLRALEAETDAQIHFSHKDDTEDTRDFDPLEMDRYTQIQELSKSLGESVDDLDSLQSILGEQVKDSETLLLQQSRINTDLQDGLIRSRMVRFSGLTARLRRLVRKTSSDLAKKAELTVEGDQHEVDIKVLDRMLAPIEHILRNSISHGIESPAERKNKGKPETGNILIKVSRDGSDVVLKISDDGAGINVRKVRTRATDLGLIGEQEELSDNDIIQFILEPGFSTADQVSQVAGRGVGMDVVKSRITQLNGSVEIESEPGKGSRFLIKLPLTLAILPTLMVVLGNQTFALPLTSVNEIFDMDITKT
ncbi:MAG: Hpt domain-containing protein, partial [Gammaproteobacteria bacterium]|nr:Hpt domain-containing protein [Gammaproteobacteria bacterium]